MSKKNKVQYIDQEEPAFLKAFKERIGYKAGPDVETKRKPVEYEERTGPEEDDEKPQVVVLKKGDLTADEADSLQTDTETRLAEEEAKREEEECAADGRVKFKKPSKRTTEDQSELNVSSNSKKKKTDKEGGQDKGKRKEDKRKQIKDKKLLSFNDEEEEDSI